MGFFSWLEKAANSSAAATEKPAAVATPTRHASVGGEIGFYGLEQWWFSELSEKDRQLILTTYQPMGADGGSDVLLSGRAMPSSQTPSTWLMTIASWFSTANPGHVDLILRIADKAWSLKDQLAPIKGYDAIYSKHLALGLLAKTYYRFRDNPDYFARSMEATQLQIDMQAEAMKAWEAEERKYNPGISKKDMARPVHEGYKRLAIVLEKDKRFQEALDVVLEAKKNHWQGDWDKRIERLKKRMKS